MREQGFKLTISRDFVNLRCAYLKEVPKFPRRNLDLMKI